MTSTEITTGDFVALERHGLSYRAEVVGVGPVNVRVRYTTKNGKTKTISENKKLVSKIDDAPPARPAPVGFSTEESRQSRVRISRANLDRNLRRAIQLENTLQRLRDEQRQAEASARKSMQALDREGMDTTIETSTYNATQVARRIKEGK